jgi:hypothetical protein
MKYLQLLRAQRAELEARHAAAVAAMEAVATAAIDETRSLSPDETKAVDEHRSAVAAVVAELGPLDERIGELELVEARTAEIASMTPRCR